MAETNLGRIGFVSQGDWSAGTYKHLDFVRHNSATYTCGVTSTTGEPGVSSDWDLSINDGSSTASAITNTPAGGIVATTVQGALNELDTEATATSVTLASTTTDEGATLIGIEDAGSYYTGTTVEAALQEAAVKINDEGSTNVNSGSEVTIFDNIPATARRITVSMLGISISLTDGIDFYVGTSAAWQTSGYVGTSMDLSPGIGSIWGVKAPLTDSGVLNNQVLYGKIVLEKCSGDVWQISSILSAASSADAYISNGSVTLSAALTRIKLQVDVGAFDSSGSVYVRYE